MTDHWFVPAYQPTRRDIIKRDGACRVPRVMRRFSLNALTIAFVAFGLPAFLGLGLLSALVVIPLTCLSVFLVADLTADSFASLDARNFVRRVGVCVLTGWASGIAIPFAALLAMNIIFWTGSLLLPPAI